MSIPENNRNTGYHRSTPLSETGSIHRARQNYGDKEIGRFFYWKRFIQQPTMVKIHARQLCVDTIDFFKRLMSHSTKDDKTAMEAFLSEEDRIDSLCEWHSHHAPSKKMLSWLCDNVIVERFLPQDNASGSIKKGEIRYLFRHASGQTKGDIGELIIKDFYKPYVDLAVRYAFLQQLPSFPQKTTPFSNLTKDLL